MFGLQRLVSWHHFYGLVFVFVCQQFHLRHKLLTRFALCCMFAAASARPPPSLARAPSIRGPCRGPGCVFFGYVLVQVPAVALASRDAQLFLFGHRSDKTDGFCSKCFALSSAAAPRTVAAPDAAPIATTGSLKKVLFCFQCKCLHIFTDSMQRALLIFLLIFCTQICGFEGCKFKLRAVDKLILCICGEPYVHSTTRTTHLHPACAHMLELTADTHACAHIYFIWLLHYCGTTV